MFVVGHGIGRSPQLQRLMAAVAMVTLFAAGASAQQLLSMGDLGLSSGYQDTFGGTHKRGRATIAADFDLDGRVDIFAGNPGDTSMILRNVSGPTGPRFVPVQELTDNEQAWGGVAFDYDNDGDYDLFISIGGNEGIGHDYLFHNDFLETGVLVFRDVTDTAGVAGPIAPGRTDPLRTASGNAVVSDYDLDGDGDIFVSTIIKPQSRPELKGRNTLWRNNDDGTFTDVTDVAGLGGTAEKTRHSTFFDFDNDGDFDLYENNFVGPNYIWRNMLKETGTATFEDATVELTLPGEDMQFPLRSFVSAVADFNNDGWEDLMVWMRGDVEPVGPDGLGAEECSGPDRPHAPPVYPLPSAPVRERSQQGPTSPYDPGHALFINQEGQGFINVAHDIGVNNFYQDDNGVMGAQVGDLNGDGTPDIFTGNGGPTSGQFDQLLLSQGGPLEPLAFVDATPLIDYPAAERPGIGYPTYPYRTHGTAIVDIDGDGLPELVVSNGGPTGEPDSVREPNRLFKAEFDTPPGVFSARVVGNGTSVSKDAIGARLTLRVRRSSDGARWLLRRTLTAGSAFSAQNGFWLSFALGDGDTLEGLEVKWPDGTVDLVRQGLGVGASLVVEQGG